MLGANISALKLAPSSQLAELSVAFAQAGFEVYTVRGDGIVDAESALMRIAAACNLRECYGGGYFQESFWGEFCITGGRKVIFWLDADRTMSEQLAAFLWATDSILNEIDFPRPDVVSPPGFPLPILVLFGSHFPAEATRQATTGRAVPLSQLGRYLDESFADTTVRRLREDGVIVHELKGENIVDNATLFREFYAAFGLCGSPVASWPELYWVLDRQILPVPERTAIVWRQANASMEHNLSMFIQAVRHLNNFSEPCFRTVDDLTPFSLYLSGTGYDFCLRTE